MRWFMAGTSTGVIGSMLAYALAARDETSLALALVLALTTAVVFSLMGEDASSKSRSALDPDDRERTCTECGALTVGDEATSCWQCGERL